jgi:Pectate lyase superfamily protein/SMP-30/Gluconolactonase/LRE-like region
VKFKILLALFAASAALSPLVAASYYTEQPKDAQAVLVTPGNFAIHGDGISDDSDAIQQAINKVQEAHNEGVALLPSGRYRISKTIYIWPGVRLIGYGATRPALVLAANTPGYQQGPSYMVFFAGDRPGTRRRNGRASNPVAKPEDANPGTFYSALSNVDIEIGDGNTGAVGVRARYAQHCFLAHIDFQIGSGLAGIHDGGNVAQDVHFHGGQYGIWTRKPSPGWQFAVIDASFEGQRVAAIREHEAGLTLIRPQISNVPIAIDIDATYPEELWIKDARLEDVRDAAIVISNENNPHTEINAEGISCTGVPTFARYRESGRTVPGKGSVYEVKAFSHGLHYDDVFSSPKIEDVFQAHAASSPMAPAKSDVPDLPPMQTWVNIRDLGAKGDGIADDTPILRKAIEGNRTIFLPAGQYRVTDTVTLKPDTVLIGLQPSITRIFLADHTPAFEGVGGPKALLETPRGGTNIVTGIGLYTNGINPRAVALKWRAGPYSMVNDVRFLGGHGTVDMNPDPNKERHGWDIYNNTHTADSNLERRWNGQYPSLWITDGGGGTFMNIWTPSTFAQAGMYISDTSTSGRVYELSSEHHVRNEIMLRNAANWQIYALQTEEERGEGGFALPLEIIGSHDITIANYHSYRVVSMFQPFPYAVKITDSKDIHLRNVHVYSDSKASFDNSVYGATHGVQVRNREFAYMDISGEAPSKNSTMRHPTLAGNDGVEKVVDGFYNISGGAIDASGDPYFVDAHWQTIYHWSVTKRELSKIRDNPLDPVNLAFDKSGNLIVVSSQGNGTVYSLKPDVTDVSITLLKPQPAVARPGAAVALPVDYWRNENDFASHITLKRPYQFVSPDGSLFLSTGEDFVNGDLYYGVKMQDVLRAYGLARVSPGHEFYVSDESQEKTYVVKVADDGNMSDPKLFVEEGGESSAVDANGNVYLAAGDIFVYTPKGERIDTIHVPERPQQLLFGGSDGKTLFILTRTSLYSVKTK